MATYQELEKFAVGNSCQPVNEARAMSMLAFNYSYLYTLFQLALIAADVLGVCVWRWGWVGGGELEVDAVYVLLRSAPLP